MKKLSILFFAFLLFGCQDEELAKVEKVFYSVNEYNIAMNGEKIYELTSHKSHDYYADLLSKVLLYDSANVARLNIINKANVLTARAGFDNDELLNMSAKDFMIRMYTELNNMDPEKIKIFKSMEIKNLSLSKSGNAARGELAPGGRPLSEKVYLYFRKENGVWKYDITSMFDFAKNHFDGLIREAGLSHNDFLTLMFEEPGFKEKMMKPLAEVWNPIKN